MTDVYSDFYPAYYGGPDYFPAIPLGLEIDLDVGGWTGITSYAVQQNAVAAVITRARQNETTNIQASTCPMRWNNIDARFDPDNPVGPYYGLLGLNTPVRISVPYDSTYLRFADDSQSYASCPDSAGLQLTGNFDVRIDMRLDDWQPCTLAGKWGNGGTGWAWCLLLNGDGTLTLTWYNGTAVQTAQSTVPLPWLGRIAVRCAFQPDVDNQVVFYTAAGMAGSFTQLGDAIPVGGEDYAQAAAGQVTQVGCVSGYVFSIASVPGGALGKIYEFQVYDSAGTLVADPVFTAQTAGATSFTDGQGNTWTTEGTAELSGRSYRYHGECSSLPEEWDPTGHDIWTPCSASGVLRRIQQGNSPILSAMRRSLPSVMAPYGAGALPAWWPCEDSQGATQIASGLPGGTPMLFTGAPGFQGQAGSPQADSLFPCSAQLPTIGTSAWIGRVTGTSAQWGTQLLLGIASGGLSADVPALAVIGYDSGVQLTVGYTTAANGTLTLTLSGFGAITGTTNVNGTALLVQVLSFTTEQFLNTLAVGAGAAAVSNGQSAAMSGNVTSVAINPAGADCGSTECGGIFVSPNPPSPAVLADLLNAYAGETAATRFARLCAQNGLNSRIYGPPDASCVMGPQQIDTLMNVLQSCEDADRGQIYEPRDVLGLGYRTLASLVNQSPAVIFDYSAGEVSPPMKPTRDDLLIKNDVTLTRNNGSSVQVQQTTGPLSVSPPPDGAGDYDTSLTVYVNDDSQLNDIAGWWVHVGTAPEKRYPLIFADLASTDTGMQDLIPQVRDTDIGDYLQVISTPQPLLPPGGIDQLAWGITETLGDFVWRFQFNAVPESPYEVMVFGTGAADSSHFDTSGSTLDGGVSPAATTLSVATTGASAALWTTSGADFPFDIAVAGERMTVTGITGTSSPQTFTVTRSVNGVVKSQASGAAVALWDTPVFALAGVS